MKKVLNFSLRNLTRQKRRNAILAVAIAFGFFVVTLIDGLTSGMVGNLENQITHMIGGSVILGGFEKTASEEEGGKDTVSQIIRDKDYIQNIVNDLKIDYEYYSRYTRTNGQLIFEGKKSLLQLYGYDLDESHFAENIQIVSGTKENFKEPNTLIISDKTAEAMNLEVGDDILISASTIFGQFNVADFKVGAIIKSNSFLNGMVAYADINSVNRLVDMPEDGYSHFSIFLKNKNRQGRIVQEIEDRIRLDGKNVTSIKDALKTNPNNIARGLLKQINSKEYQWEGTKYYVSSLNYEVPAMKTVLSVVHTISTVILIVILLIVMVGVSNTYRMILYERIREIGTMRALGMSENDTRKTFTSEAVALCLIGAAAGFLFSLIVMFVVHLIPISNEAISFFLKDGHFTFRISAVSVVIQYLILIVLTSLAVRDSAKKAALMSPAEALRTVK